MHTWESLQGHILSAGYYLKVGFYRDGSPALQAFTLDHQPECTVTVNLEGESLEDNEFFVRCEVKEFSEVPQALLREGIAEKTGRYVSSGRVEKYAEIWRLRQPSP